MQVITIEVVNHTPHPLPSYATEQAAGMDIRASTSSPIQLEPMERKLISTGLFIALPPGYEGQLRARSGLGLAHGVTVLNAPGTIDADYRGEIKVLLINLSKETFTIHDGDRIAQLVIQPYTRARWAEVSALNPTPRGKGGYGSTGVS